ncbi:MAG: hypothetical protein A2103_00585 [Gammaproteobacteria bacterium GWF2_41_13]|nr:MAG: hypothetical protein A2103_00585 [Gammaproteobacteria bacterium GWF2_41_13]
MMMSDAQYQCAKIREEYQQATRVAAEQFAPIAAKFIEEEYRLNVQKEIARIRLEISKKFGPEQQAEYEQKLQEMRKKNRQMSEEFWPEQQAEYKKKLKEMRKKIWGDYRDLLLARGNVYDPHQRCIVPVPVEKKKAAAFANTFARHFMMEVINPAIQAQEQFQSLLAEAAEDLLMTEVVEPVSQDQTHEQFQTLLAKAETALQAQIDELQKQADDCFERKSQQTMDYLDADEKLKRMAQQQVEQIIKDVRLEEIIKTGALDELIKLKLLQAQLERRLYHGETPLYLAYGYEQFHIVDYLLQGQVATYRQLIQLNPKDASLKKGYFRALFLSRQHLQAIQSLVGDVPWAGKAATMMQATVGRGVLEMSDALIDNVRQQIISYDNLLGRVILLALRDLKKTRPQLYWADMAKILCRWHSDALPQVAKLLRGDIHNTSLSHQERLYAAMAFLELPEQILPERFKKQVSDLLWFCLADEEGDLARQAAEGLTAWIRRYPSWADQELSRLAAALHESQYTQKILRQRDLRWRIQAIKLLGHGDLLLATHRVEAIGLLQKQLSDENLKCRVYAARSLIALGEVDGAIVDALISCFNSSVVDMRWMAEKCLIDAGLRNQQLVIARCEQALLSPQACIRLSVAETLVCMMNDHFIIGINRDLLKQKLLLLLDPANVLQCCCAVGLLMRLSADSSGYVERLLHYADHSDPNVRWHAFLALRRSGEMTEALLDLAARGLRDKDDRIVKIAEEILVERRYSDSFNVAIERKMLMFLEKSVTRQERCSAAKILGERGIMTTEITTALKTKLSADYDIETRFYAAQSLVQLGCRSDRDLIMATLQTAYAHNVHGARVVNLLFRLRQPARVFELMQGEGFVEYAELREALRPSSYFQCVDRPALAEQARRQLASAWFNLFYCAGRGDSVAPASSPPGEGENLKAHQVLRG